MERPDGAGGLLAVSWLCELHSSVSLTRLVTNSVNLYKRGLSLLWKHRLPRRAKQIMGYQNLSHSITARTMANAT